MCVFNETRLIRYDSYVTDGIPFCTNDQYCLNTVQTIECSLWTAYCKPYYDMERNLSSSQRKNSTITDDGKLEDFLDNPVHEKYAYLCHYFEEQGSVQLKKAIPGISSKDLIKGNALIIK